MGCVEPAAPARASGSAPACAPHEALAEAFDAVDRLGVAWAVLRAIDDPGSPRQDVDLLVAPEGADQAFAAAGFVAVAAPGRGPHRFFVRYVEPDDVWIKLDVVTALAYGRYHELATDAAPGVLARRRHAGETPVLAPDDAFWTLLLHCLFDKRRLAPAHRLALRELAPRAEGEGDLTRLVEAFAPNGRGVDFILAAARQGEWGKLERLGPALRRRWIRRRPSAGATLLANAALRRTGISALAARRPPILEVVGAAAATSRLVRALRESCPVPLRAVRGSMAARVQRLRGHVVLLERTPGACPPGAVRPAARIVVDDLCDPEAARRTVSAELWHLLAGGFSRAAHA